MAGLTSYVPIVRKILEALIFRVKGMLVANNSPDAFWMGNLKNKTIKGDEILSQVGILCEMLSFSSLTQYCTNHINIYNNSHVSLINSIENLVLVCCAFAGFYSK
jgi:hypothetical protein